MTLPPRFLRTSAGGGRTWRCRVRYLRCLKARRNGEAFLLQVMRVPFAVADLGPRVHSVRIVGVVLKRVFKEALHGAIELALRNDDLDVTRRGQAERMAEYRAFQI